MRETRGTRAKKEGEEAAAAAAAAAAGSSAAAASTDPAPAPAADNAGAQPNAALRPVDPAPAPLHGPGPEQANGSSDKCDAAKEVPRADADGPAAKRPKLETRKSAPSAAAEEDGGGSRSGDKAAAVSGQVTVAIPGPAGGQVAGFPPGVDEVLVLPDTLASQPGQLDQKVKVAMEELLSKHGSVLAELEQELEACVQRSGAEDHRVVEARARATQAELALKRAEEAVRIARKAARNLQEAAQAAEDRAREARQVSDEARERMLQVRLRLQRVQDATLSRLESHKSHVEAAYKELKDATIMLALGDEAEGSVSAMAKLQEWVTALASSWFHYTVEQHRFEVASGEGKNQLPSAGV
eukprot:SM000230S07341  [mRNA]  locus=s230:117667:119244:+ [translate_table: standard]